MSIQETYNFVYGFPILFLRNVSLAWCLALMDMIIQTRSLFPYVFWQRTVTAADMIKLTNQFYRIFHCACTGIRTKIFCLVLLHLSCQHNPRKRLIYCNFYKRITLVIHQHSIILRSVFLYQITLQHQCFQFRICHNVFKSGNMCHHLFYLGTFIPAALKILTHTVL